MAQTAKVVKRVKVWNKDKVDYKQMVRGEEVYIPAGKFIEVGRRKGVEIKGHFTGKYVAAMLEIEPIIETGEESEVWMNHKTGRVFATRDELLKDLGVDPKAADAVKNATRYTCPICDESFTTKDAIVAHMPNCLARVKPNAVTK
jgi:hypothetical protein